MTTKGNIRFLVVGLVVVLNARCMKLGLPNGAGNGVSQNSTEAVSEAIATGTKWVLEQLNTSSTRSFHDEADSINYNGKLAHLKLIVDFLKGDTVLFASVQSLLESIMRDPRFIQIHQQTKVRVITDAELNSLGFHNLDGLNLNGEILIVAERAKNLMGDIRGVYVVLFHEYLHRYGIGQDQLSFGGAAPLSAYNNGQVINFLAVTAVLLSSEFRSGLPGDNENSAISWVPRLISEFDDAKSAPWPAVGDPWESFATATEKEGFAQGEGWIYMRLKPELLPRKLKPSVRFRGRLVFPSGIYLGQVTLKVREQYNANPVIFNGGIEVQMSQSQAGVLSITARASTSPLNASAGGCSGTFPLPWVAGSALRFSLVALGEDISMWLNNTKVCSFLSPGSITSTDGIGINTFGAYIDWLQVDDTDAP